MYAKQWKQLSEKDEQKFREYARQTYAPGSDINEVWHPIMVHECYRINCDAGILPTE
jgi:hypothetical protein